MMKTWYKAQNNKEWCIYYATTDNEGRTYKNHVCECWSEEEADQILSLQFFLYMVFKISQDKNNNLDDIKRFIHEKCGDHFLIDMETALVNWLEKNEKLP